MNRRLKITMMMSTLALGYPLAYATPPQAPQDDAPSMVVRFADLDLTHSAGAAVLYSRLKNAAETVCATLNEGDLASWRIYENCWRGALSRAVGKVNRPTLTAYYRARFKGRSEPVMVAQK